MADQKGFLTEADREFLRGEREYTGENAKQMRYQRRQSIRERTRGAFRDFALLHDELDKTERNKIFDPPGEEVSPLLTALQKTIALLYHSLEGDVDDPGVHSRSFSYSFDDILEVGIKNGEAERQPQDPSDVHVEYEPYSLTVRRAPEPADREHVVESLAKGGGFWGLSENQLRYTIGQAALETATGEKLSGDNHSAEDCDDDEEIGLRRLAEEIEQKAQELEESDDVDEE